MPGSPPSKKRRPLPLSASSRPATSSASSRSRPTNTAEDGTALSWAVVRWFGKPGALLDLEKLLAHGVDDRLHARVQVELLEDVADVVLDGVLGDEELLRDVAVVAALRD